uniref:HNH endonuclease n=1 Tax=Schistosoma curassoni TaxID=6186 RepID=A0A183KZL9_9TREM
MTIIAYMHSPTHYKYVHRIATNLGNLHRTKNNLVIH